MKKISYLLVLIFFLACNSEDAPNCFQKEGTIITTTFDMPSFQKIRIEDDVSLVIRQGDVQEVLIETGENLLNDVSVTVEDETLVVRDNNRCNLVRDYGITRAIVTVPNLIEIRNSSEYNVVSEGVLRFNFLQLVSNTTGGIEDTRKSGDFTLTIECADFRVAANGFSAFYIDGYAEKAILSFEDEVPLFEGADLLVDDLRILHRSANRMVVNPRERIRGEIRGTGDVIAVNRPPVVTVEEIFTGRLIFQD